MTCSDENCRRTRRALERANDINERKDARIAALEAALRLAEPILMTSPHPTGCGWLKGRPCDCGIDAAVAALPEAP